MEVLEERDQSEDRVDLKRGGTRIVIGGEMHDVNTFQNLCKIR